MKPNGVRAEECGESECRSVTERIEVETSGQITADLFGCKVQKIQTYETSALGAAMASFTGVGEYKQLSDAVKNMSHVTYEYVPNKENHEVYRKLYDRVYRKLYDANKKFYKEIREIIKH